MHALFECYHNFEQLIIKARRASTKLQEFPYVLLLLMMTDAIIFYFAVTDVLKNKALCGHSSCKIDNKLKLLSLN